MVQIGVPFLSPSENFPSRLFRRKGFFPGAIQHPTRQSAGGAGRRCPKFFEDFFIDGGSNNIPLEAGGHETINWPAPNPNPKLFAEALKYIPGGVNSPVRAFRAVGGQPFFVNRAKGAHVWDVDGNELIDYVCTWGPAILGHAHPKIISAVKAAADHGTSFGIPNPFEVTMAKLICAGAQRAEGADVQFGHRGVHVGHSPGARVHQARQNHQVRRLLSRPRGFAAGEGRLRRADVWPSRQRRGARRVHAAHHRSAVQRRGSRQGRFRREQKSNRRHHRRAGAGQCGIVSAEAGLSGIPARNHEKRTARC
jgi:hypothetical protein